MGVVLGVSQDLASACVGLISTWAFSRVFFVFSAWKSSHSFVQLELSVCMHDRLEACHHHTKKIDTSLLLLLWSSSWCARSRLAASQHSAVRSLPLLCPCNFAFYFLSCARRWSLSLSRLAVA